VPPAALSALLLPAAARCVAQRLLAAAVYRCSNDAVSCGGIVLCASCNAAVGIAVAAAAAVVAAAVLLLIAAVGCSCSCSTVV
jgi:hypothetical protein